MCCALLEQEPQIESSDIYGLPGQTQDGIDVLAERHDGGRDAAQCKCYRYFSPGKIEFAANEFLKHVGKWKDQNLRRFILMTACGLSSRKQIQKKKQITTSMKANHGIYFKAWSNRVIQNKLRPHRGIVFQYLGKSPEIVDIICGPAHTTPQLRSKPPGVEQQPLDIPQTIIKKLNAAALKDLKEIVKLYTEGKPSSGLEKLLEFKKDDEQWNLLDNGTKAKFLRVEAQLRLRAEKDLAGAKALADEADSLHLAVGSTLLRALLLLHDQGAQAALDSLGDTSELKLLMFKASLLMTLDAFDQASPLIERFPTEGDDKDEALRLRAHVRLYGGKIESALRLIDQAFESNKESFVIRADQGVLRYYSALSPLARPKSVMAVPEPVDWMLVRRDDQSRVRLREAAAIFKILLETCEPDQEQRRHLEGWRLACLACNLETISEAEEYCRSLLANDRTHDQAILWGLSRSLASADILSRSITPLQEQIEDAPTLEAIISLCGLYLYFGPREQAARLVQDERARFEQAGQIELWEAWAALTQEATPDERENHPESLIEHFRIAKARSDFNALEALIKTILAEKRSQQILPEICVILASNNQWTCIAEHAEALIELIGTDTIVDMAAIACANVRRPKDALRILDANKDKFPKQTLPLHLRRVYYDSKFHAGLVNEAVKGVERIALETRTLEDSLWLADMYRQKGDMSNAKHVIKKVQSEKEIPPDKALFFASSFIAHDPEVSKELFLNATREDIPHEYLSHAHMLSIQLGLEREAEHIARRFYEEAARGTIPDVQSVTMEDVRSMMQSRNEQAIILEERHNAGIVPVHLAFDALNEKLVKYYHVLPVRNASKEEFQKKSSLLYRHGGLETVHSFPEHPSDIRLHVDISSLLLANHLGILCEVEQLFKPLMISKELIACLQEMCSAINPAQPRWVQATDTLLGLIAENKVRVFFEGDVTPTPLLTLDWTKNAKQASAISLESSCNCRALADSLLVLGAISTTSHEEAIAALGVEAEEIAEGMHLQRNACVFCKDNTAQLLAFAGLLNAACNAFTLYVAEDSVDILRQESRNNSERTDTAKWLKALLDRVSNGITIERYAFIESQIAPEADDRAMKLGHASAVLEALVSVPCGQSTVLWCDDRCINSYKTQNGFQIACVSDILLALRTYGAITEALFFERMQYLRNINAQFIPLTADELSYHLSNAPIIDDVLQETPELSILRRYYASCFSVFNKLQLQEVPEHVRSEGGEIRFIHHHHKALAQAVSSLWKQDNITDTEKVARADWVMRHLFIERYPEMPSRDNGTFPALFHASFLAQGFDLCFNAAGNVTKRCSKFVSWYSDRILSERLRASVELDKEIAQLLVHFVFEISPDENEILGELGGDDARSVLDTVFKRIQLAFFSYLPHSIVEKIKEHDCVREMLQNSVRHNINLGNFEFDFNVFAEQTAKALSGEIVTVMSKDGTNISLESEAVSDNETFALRMTPGIEGESVLVKSPINCVFYSDPSQRAACLEAYAGDFDRTTEQLHTILSMIADEPDTLIRFAKAQRILLDSCIARYTQLSDKLRGAEELVLEDLLPPSADALASYLRLASNDPEVDAFELAAERLLREVGMAETLHRFSGLPRPFPRAVIHKLEAMREEDRASCIAEWAAHPNYPLFVFHYVRLALKFQLEDNDKLAGLIEYHLCHEGFARAMDIFKAILEWSSNVICSFPETAPWPYWMRLSLSWSHASQVTGLLLRRDVLGENFSGFLRMHSRGVPLQDLLHEGAHGQDVASPRTFNTTRFTFAALTYALESSGKSILSTEAKKVLHKMGFLYPKEKTYPAFELLNDSANAPDVLESFLRMGLDTMIDVLKIDELEAADWNSDRRAEEYQEVLDSTKLTTEIQIIHLISSMSYAVIPERCKGNMLSWLSRVDFFDLLQTNYELALASLIWTSRLTAHYEHAELYSHIKSIACTFAQEKAPLLESGLTKEKWTFAILEPLFWLALGEGELEAYLKRLIYFLEMVIEIDHDLAPYALTLVEQHCKQLPYENIEDISKMILRLRT